MVRITITINLCYCWAVASFTSTSFRRIFSVFTFLSLVYFTYFLQILLRLHNLHRWQSRPPTTRLWYRRSADFLGRLQPRPLKSTFPPNVRTDLKVTTLKLEELFSFTVLVFSPTIFLLIILRLRYGMGLYMVNQITSKFSPVHTHTHTRCWQTRVPASWSRRTPGRR